MSPSTSGRAGWEAEPRQKRSVSLADTASPLFHRIHHQVLEGTNWRHSNCLHCLVIYKSHNTTGAVHLTCINTLTYTQIQLAAGDWNKKRSHSQTCRKPYSRRILHHLSCFHVHVLPHCCFCYGFTLWPVTSGSYRIRKLWCRRGVLSHSGGTTLQRAKREERYFPATLEVEPRL